MKVSVSVIVAIYNIELYLPRCIDSILSQTFKDFELILVDDGSTDSCGKICDDYALKYNKVTVIHKKNGGASDSRNAGLDIARGDYVYFVDGDDHIDKNLLKDMVALMENGNQMVSFGYFYEYEDGTLDSYNGHKAAGESFCLKSDKEKFDFMADTLLLYKIGWSVWSRIYDRHIIEKYHIRFENNKKDFAEDLYFLLCYVPHIEKIDSVKKNYYYYVQRSNSIIHQNIHQKRYAENVGHVDKLCRELLKHYEKYDDCAFLVKNFSLIYFLVINHHLEIYLQENPINVKQTRAVIMDNLSDMTFFKKNINHISKYKKYLLPIYGRHRTNELLRNYHYYTNGNYFMLFIKNIISDKLYYINQRKENLAE